VLGRLAHWATQTSRCVIFHHGLLSRFALNTLFARTDSLLDVTITYTPHHQDKPVYTEFDSLVEYHKRTAKEGSSPSTGRSYLATCPQCRSLRRSHPCIEGIFVSPPCAFLRFGQHNLDDYHYVNEMALTTQSRVSRRWRTGRCTVLPFPPNPERYTQCGHLLPETPPHPPTHTQIQWRLLLVARERPLMAHRLRMGGHRLGKRQGRWVGVGSDV
jgi:hypothetical protein